MCFALPLRVTSISKDQAIMEDGRSVALTMVGSAKMGDWLLVQSNLAVEKLSYSEARAIRSAIKEVSDELRDA